MHSILQYLLILRHLISLCTVNSQNEVHVKHVTNIYKITQQKILYKNFNFYIQSKKTNKNAHAKVT